MLTGKGFSTENATRVLLVISRLKLQIDTELSRQNEGVTRHPWYYRWKLRCSTSASILLSFHFVIFFLLSFHFFHFFFASISFFRLLVFYFELFFVSFSVFPWEYKQKRHCYAPSFPHAPREGSAIPSQQMASLDLHEGRSPWMPSR